jgi:hypothetical protein
MDRAQQQAAMIAFLEAASEFAEQFQEPTTMYLIKRAPGRSAKQGGGRHPTGGLAAFQLNPPVEGDANRGSPVFASNWPSSRAKAIVAD